MGLLDQVLGGVFGGQQSGSQPGSSMSPIAKAVMLLLAGKAYQHFTTQGAGAGASPSGGLGGLLGGLSGSSSGGGLGGLLGGAGTGGLGGLLAGLGGASALGGLVEQFQRRGFGGHVDSWVGTGANQPIEPNQLESALGSDTLDELSQHFNMPRDQLASELSAHLPEALDRVTPEGRLPSDDVLTRGI